MARWRTLHRQDSTAKLLIEEAESYGAKYLPLDGVIDGVLWFRANVYLIDWKGPKTKRTDRQMKLVMAGWPIWFIENSVQLRELLFGKAA